MKNLFPVLLAGLAVACCTACSEKKGYEVNVAFSENPESHTTLYLVDREKNPVDSALLVDNSFQFKGQTDSTNVYFLCEKNKENGQYNRLMQLILQNDAKVNITLGETVKVEDQGGVNSIYTNYRNELLSFSEESTAKYREMMANKAERDTVIAFMESVNEKIEAMWKQAFLQNSQNLAGTAILADNCRSFENLDSLQAKMNMVPSANLFPAFQKQIRFLNNLLNTAEGKMFVDFEGKDLEGNVSKLSDFVGKGKYVLVDFWASWCGPCRGEIPNLIAVNKKFASEKFMVLGVNVWDQDKKFRKALETEKIDYTQIYASDTKDATDLYGINGIPQIMLFAPDGTIVKRDLRGEAIAETVQAALKK